MPETLLQKAKKVRIERSDLKDVKDEEFELAMAWVNAEITYKQAAIAIGKYSSGGGLGGTPYWLARTIRIGIARGYINKVTKK